MKSSTLDEFYELIYFMLAHPDTLYFIHQHIVDAQQAQTADDNTKPIAITFSLIGFYLYLKKEYTGRRVQRAHTKLSQHKKIWPKIELPNKKGEITVTDVLKATPRPMRDAMIKDWCSSVWQAYSNYHDAESSLVKSELGV